MKSSRFMISNLLDYHFRQRTTVRYFRSGFVNCLSLTLLSVFCCWAGIRMLTADWLRTVIYILEFLSQKIIS